ncbi:ABC transporter permease [Spirochaetia bacterium]|nr:ABC transporter permease [Spirochaetia bacterium]
MEKIIRDKKAILIFVLPGLLFYFFIIIMPIFRSFYYSLLGWNGINKAAFIGLGNFFSLITDVNKNVYPSVGHSLVLAALSVFIQLPISLVLALLLNGGVKGEKFFRTVYFIPVIISTVIIGELWKKIYHPTYGILNVLLGAMGLDSLAQEWLGSTNTALFAAFIPMIWQYIGYHMLLMYTAAKAISRDIYEAARVDGASDFAISLRITIPQMLPMIKACIIFAIIGSLKSFDLIYILTKGGPMGATEVPSTLMYNEIFTRYAYGYGSAIAVFIVFECLFFTVLVQNIFPKDLD